MTAGNKVVVVHLEELLDWQGALLTVCKYLLLSLLSQWSTQLIRGAYLVTFCKHLYFDEIRLVCTHPCCFAYFCSFSTDRVALRDDDDE